MKPSELSAFLSRTIPAGLPVLITGAPGTGKSDIVTSACIAAGAELIISHPVVSDPTDYKGLPYAADGEAKFLPFGDLNRLIKATSRTVFFLDDLGQAPPSVQSACMQLILARRINGHMVSDQVTFLAATNRKQDRANVSGILEPVKSRFSTIIELTPDLDDWVNWALANGVPTELIAFIRFRSNFLFDFKPSADMKQSSCPRTITNAGKLLSLGFPEAQELEVFAGAAGEAFAVEFTAFLRMFRRMISPDAVLMSPDTAPIPDDISTLYALCTALARLVDVNSVDRFFRYCNRLPDEFSVMAVSDATRTKPELQNTRSFIDWTIKHKSVMV